MWRKQLIYTLNNHNCFRKEKNYRPIILDVRDSDKTIQPCGLSDVIVELLNNGVELKIIYDYEGNKEKTLMVIADIVRQIDEHLNVVKKFFLTYVPIIVSIVALLTTILISILK